MRRRFFLLVVVLLSFAIHAQGQRTKFRKAIDSLFIDHNPENYSLRLFSNYKVKRFKISNEDFKTRYVPKNRFGVGVGVANSKVLLDLAINIKNGQEEVTKRFDAQGTIIFKKRNYLNAYLQIYNGFNVKNDFGEPNEFRFDIKSRTLGFNHLYTFSDVEFSYSLLKAGLPTKNKDVYITGGIGSFVMFDYFDSDTSIFPENVALYYDDVYNIKRYSGRALGLLTGVMSAFVLPKNIIATCNLMPGIAIIDNRVTLEDGSRRGSTPMLYKLDASFALSYSVKRYYINLMYETGMYANSLNFGHNYRFNLSMAKLSFGYKLNM
ncbi:DUF4421 family protein [Mangrovimonas sp. YM274]|uniref:DUF4421 family protein n=1 Tax=Mangrovimonas sp. YM274 TaxID=3070660 RepID=UPI0027DB4599|nr:DUF4421 family protein [Mangrovimonas sp. YM274]WMI69002.1 DUF4421 family protein [Mangrovimonas sp. YM274]